MGLPKEHRSQGEKGAADEEQSKTRVAGASGRRSVAHSAAAVAADDRRIVHTRRELFAWIQQVGINALQELFELDVVEMAGAKGKHCPERSHYRWGAAPIVLPFGGQRITVPCPRVRAVRGREAQLKSARHFRAVDPVPARVLNQILLGVSTRGYRPSLEPVPAGISARGASKSAASRHLIARMSGQLHEQLSRRLDQLDLLVLLVDGIEIAHRTVVVALGILADGRKVVLGLWLGSTENAALCTALLNDLLERGLKVDGRILCVIDGGRGIRKALADVFGDLAVVQRCRVHSVPGRAHSKEVRGPLTGKTFEPVSLGQVVAA